MPTIHIRPNVAPLVGAWIEINIFHELVRLTWSLLSWERGLKFLGVNYDKDLIDSRSSRGSVD